MHLGRNCRRLHDLRLAATGFAAVPRRSGHHRRLVFHRQRIVDVAGLRCVDVYHLLVAETGILNSNRPQNLLATDGHGQTQRGLRRNHRFWTAAGSEAPRHFWTPPAVSKAVSPLRSSLRCASPRQAATAVQIFVVRARSSRIVLRIRARREFRELTRIQLAIIYAIRVKPGAPVFPIRVNLCPSVVKNLPEKNDVFSARLRVLHASALNF